MSSSLGAIGLSGIFAAEANIAATEANIANASNPNYSVESVTLAARAGSQGRSVGVDVLGTNRAVAPFLSGEINSQQSSSSFDQQFVQATTLAQNLVSPASGADLGTIYQKMLNAFTNLSASPEDPTARAAVLNDAGQFARAAQNISSKLTATAANQLSQLAPLVSQVNDIDRQIASLNQQINSTKAGGASGAALLDQRDALVGQLAQMIGATADSNGNVSIGGVPLVTGANPLTLATTGSGANTGLEVTLSQGALPIQLAQVGGSIAGLMAAAAQVNQLQSALDTFSSSVAGAINSIHQSGYGLDGSTNNQLFLIPGANGGPIQLNPAINVQNLAASSSAAGVPGDGSNASAIAAIANTLSLDPSLPNRTLGQAFTEILASFGTAVSNAQNDQTQSSATLQSLQTLKGSITGVSLNDQLSKLIEYQSVLQASGRAVQAANDIIQFLVQELN
jgi:flagellar hook-associated protein 1 FlgK